MTIKFLDTDTDSDYFSIFTGHQTFYRVQTVNREDVVYIWIGNAGGWTRVAAFDIRPGMKANDRRKAAAERAHHIFYPKARS